MPHRRWRFQMLGACSLLFPGISVAETDSVTLENQTSEVILLGQNNTDHLASSMGPGNATDDVRSDEPQEKDDDTNAEGPRFTRAGCLCRERWRAIGHESTYVTRYCGNPDGDPGGEWCFVVDSGCQGKSNWGYCAPHLRCAIGTSVALQEVGGRWQVFRIMGFSGRQVLLVASDGLTQRADISEVFLLDGEPCLHGLGMAQQIPGVTSTTATTTIQSIVLSTTSAPRTITQNVASTAPSPTPRQVSFDAKKHGSALSLRLDWDFVNVLQQRHAFEATILRATATAIQQPAASIQVLAMMRGSVIVAVGVVPLVCTPDNNTFTLLCYQALVQIRRLWEAALRDPGSALRTALGRTDPVFPTELNRSECEKRGLPCSWLEPEDQVPNRCGPESQCTSSTSRLYREDNPWWFMSLFAFAGATPLCFCFGMTLFKATAPLSRFLRRRRYLREISADACTLQRIEIQTGDLYVGESWACSICLSNHQEGVDLLLLPCKHTFHYNCMMQWVQRKPACPLCRSSFRLRDCAIYSTPCLLVPESSEDETEDEEVEGQVQVPLTRMHACLPNAVVDDAEPWWASLPSALANRASLINDDL